MYFKHHITTMKESKYRVNLNLVVDLNYNLKLDSWFIFNKNRIDQNLEKVFEQLNIVYNELNIETFNSIFDNYKENRFYTHARYNYRNLLKINKLLTLFDYNEFKNFELLLPKTRLGILYDISNKNIKFMPINDNRIVISDINRRIKYNMDVLSFISNKDKYKFIQYFAYKQNSFNLLKDSIEKELMYV